LGSGALPSPVQTNDSGVWFQTGFEPGTTYTATATLGTYAFNPPSRDFTTTLELDFAATFIECNALAPLAIAPGQTERGTLTTGDCTSPVFGTNHFADRYSFTRTGGVKGQSWVPGRRCTPEVQ